MVHPKVSYFFFFLIKFMGHSINQIVKLCIFFFPRSGKKKIQGCIFFFPRKSSWAIHSGFGGFLFIFFESCLCFFFSNIFGCFLCVFFFPVKVHMSFIQSISGLYFFFFVAGKKKIQLFHSINRFFPKMWKKWTFTGKKKNTIPLV